MTQVKDFSKIRPKNGKICLFDTRNLRRSSRRCRAAAALHLTLPLALLPILW
jgi:hypothetical protein